MTCVRFTWEGLLANGAVQVSAVLLGGNVTSTFSEYSSIILPLQKKTPARISERGKIMKTGKPLVYNAKCSQAKDKGISMVPLFFFLLYMIPHSQYHSFLVPLV